MSDATRDPYDDRLANLADSDLERVLRVFLENLDADYAASLNSCVHCGLCKDTCHYALTYDDVESLPAYKLGLVTGVFRRYTSFLGKHSPRWVGAAPLDRAMVERWVDSLFGRCSLCGRCGLNCSMGINIPYLIRVARGALAAVDLVPPGLQSTITTALEKGNNMGISEEDWVETVEWLEDELRGEVDDENATLPLDVPGRRLFYTINPREAMFFPLSIVAVGKIFHAAGESWTLSRTSYDVTNYGLYGGVDKDAGSMSKRLADGLKALGSQQLVLAECGHGYNSNRWEAPGWLHLRYDFEVTSILNVVAGYIREKRIKLDPARNEKRITLHDPCNLVRLGGVVEEQRFILRQATDNFVEMNPNRTQNFCCGGGGGQLAMTRFAERRLKVGKIKADQIRATGAEIVVTPCHNCIDQLMELNKHYKLGVEIKTVAEIVANALVI
jgi:Fe-S oxidoreductase